MEGDVMPVLADVVIGGGDVVGVLLFILVVVLVAWVIVQVVRRM
jgi:uncharacterized membrane protein